MSAREIMMLEIRICDSADILEGGDGLRFPVTAGSDAATGFVVRYDGVVHAYLNRCAHVPVELDWESGKFFESSGLYIMCATHGAIYMPDTGYCTGGPCRGSHLRKIKVIEKDGQIFWYPDDYLKPVIS